MWSLNRWKPGCWSAAMLRICEQHIVWDNEDEGTRFPEQWMFVLWRPTAQASPLGRPDAWGLTIGDPQAELMKHVGDAGNLYRLPDDECLWSSWLTIPQVCDHYEPWLTQALEACIQAQRAAERARYARWYGDEGARFNEFLKRVLPQ